MTGSLMTMFDAFAFKGPVFAPEGEGSTTTTTTGEGEGGTTTTTTGEGEGGTTTTTTGEGEGDKKSWYDTHQWSDPKLKDVLVRNGYHKGSPEEALERALKGEATAMSRLGKSPDTLLDKPAEGQDVSEWLKANGAAFGLPDKAEGYELKVPDGLPKNLPIDEGLLGRFAETAYDMGMPPKMAQVMVDFHAKSIAETFSGLSAKEAQAEEALNTELKSSWGADWEGKRDMAVRGFQALAVKAGMDADAMKVLASKMNEATGDAGLLKFGYAMAELIGEDTLAIPQGGNRPAMAIADAEQRKQQIMAPHEGDMAMAKAKGDRRRVEQLKKELDGLNVLITK